MQTATNPQTGEKVAWNGAAWVPAGAAPPASAPGVVTVGTPRPKKEDAPSGYRWGPSGELVAIPGGPADPNKSEDNDPPSGYRWGANGELVPIPGGPADKPGAGGGDPKTKESESTAAFLATNLVGNARLLSKALEADPSVAAPTWGQKAAGLLGQDVKNEMLPAQRQVVEDSQISILDAALTLGTGAAYNREQLEGYRQAYFPQIGDKPEAIAAKRERLRIALAAARLKAGAAAPQIDEALAALGLTDEPGKGGKPVFDVGDATEQRVLAPGGAGVKLATGDTQTVSDPVLAGLNARVNQMLKEGKPIGAVAKLITDAGIPINEVTPALHQAAKFRRENPGYKGDWDVRLDETDVPLDGVRQAAAIASAGPVGAAGIAAGNIVTGNHLDNIVGAVGGNADLANVGMSALREEHPYASLAGDVVGGVGLYGAGRAIAGQVAKRVPGISMGSANALSPMALAGDAAMGGYIGSGADGTEAFSLSGTALGAVTGAAGGAAGRGAINTLGRAVSPTGGRLAPIYEANPDFRPSLGQRTGGAWGRLEEVHASVPGLGEMVRSNRGAAVDQAQRGAFNLALKEIDDELPSGVTVGTQAHAYMQRAFNKVYDTARSGMTFKPDGDFATEFGTVLRDVELLPPASQNTFKQLAMQAGSRLKARGGQLTGADYKMISSRINAKVRAIRKNPSGDGELADALERFSVALDDGARRHSSPEAAELLDKADRGYVKSVILENAGRTAGDAGEFSGAALENAIKQGAGGLRSRVFLRGEAPMQDYAAAMKELGNKVPDSGTPERYLATAGIVGSGAAGATVSPLALIPSAVALGANTPGIRRVVGAALAPNRKRLAPARKQIIDRARLGSLFGISLTGSQSQ